MLFLFMATYFFRTIEGYEEKRARIEIIGTEGARTGQQIQQQPVIIYERDVYAENQTVDSEADDEADDILDEEVQEEIPLPSIPSSFFNIGSYVNIPTEPPTLAPTQTQTQAPKPTSSPTPKPTSSPTPKPTSSPTPTIKFAILDRKNKNNTTTSMPTTQPPLTEPPLTQPLLTQPPLTQPPLNQPPLNQPPLTQPSTPHSMPQPTSEPMPEPEPEPQPHATDVNYETLQPITQSPATQVPTKFDVGSRLTEEEARSIVEFHNRARAKHATQPVEWDAGIAKLAQKFIETCPVAHSDTPYGENLAWGQYNFDDAMYDWYNEEYDYDIPTFEEDAGHFTQMVWTDTKRIGCAKNMACRVLGTVNAFTCYYDPPGNILGVDWSQKVKRPIP